MSLENVLNDVSIPKHMFAKKELYNLLRNGDCRVDNILVVDFQGYLRLIQVNTVDKINLDIMPVRYKTFLAGTKVIGNGQVILNSLEEIFKACLQGWLDYLKTKKSVYIESTQVGKTKEQLKKEIKEVYSSFKVLT